jgi:hypothetical protein
MPVLQVRRYLIWTIGVSGIRNRLINAAIIMATVIIRLFMFLLQFVTMRSSDPVLRGSITRRIAVCQEKIFGGAAPCISISFRICYNE